MKRCFIFAAGTFYGLRRKPEEPEDDPFEDIFKIFNKRD